MKNIVLNFSGHLLCDEAKRILLSKFDYIEEVEFDTFDFSYDIKFQIENLTDKLKIKLKTNDKTTIILPGHSMIAVFLFAHVSRILGKYPDLCLLELNNDGIYTPTKFYEVSEINKW